MLNHADVFGISELHIASGKVYLLADNKLVENNLHLRAGDIRLALVPAICVDYANSASFTGSYGRFWLASRPQSASAARIPDAIVTCETKGDWALEGEEVTKVTFNTTSDAISVPISSPAQLPINFSGSIELTALLAAHRAHCSFVVRLEHPKSNDFIERSVAIDGKYLGGKFEAGYQAVKLILDDIRPGSEVTLFVRFDGWMKDAKREALAYAFVARARWIELTSRLNSSGPVPASELVSPISFISARTLGAKWFVADLPNGGLARFAVLALSDDNNESILFNFSEVSVSIVRDEGHTIVLRSATQIDVLLKLDGTSVMRLALKAGETHVRLPTAWLTGELTHLVLRDSSDSITLFQTAIIPPRVLTPADVLLKESRAPYPVNLFAASGFRYNALRAHAERPVVGVDTRQLAWAISVLEGGYDKVKLRPIAFPVIEEPDVSVVIPAHNKVSVTYSCLCALLLAWNKASFEVILVDDASSDETATIESLVSGITVVRNKDAQRFIRSCNAGAAEARGKYVVLLNNDTEPTTGWLDNLIDAFSRFANVGLAGSKLLFPDGRLQDAGGIIWGTGNPWNYGSRQNPWEPRFSYSRQADYLSGAALMVPRDIWEKVGGLSSYLEPMYFEDTDLAFKVRDLGYTTWFVPGSIVFHHEGMTSGTDTSSGFKRFQEVNRPKFKRKWSRAFSSFGKEGIDPDLEKDRGIIGRVLFVDYTTPRPDQDAGSYAAIQEIKLVQSLGYKVTFLPENLAHFGSYTTALESQGVEVIVAPFVLSVNEYIEKHAKDFNALYVTRYHVARNILPAFRSANPHGRILLNNADLHFLRQMRAAFAEGDAAKMADADRVRELELGVMRSVDLVLSYNEVEHTVIQSHTRNEVKVMKCPWVVEMPSDVPARSGRAGLSFLGGFRHFPNADGVKWLAREVMSLLGDALPDTVLSIYGSGMGPDIQALERSNIRAVGFVEDVAEAFDPHLVFVAPLLSGAGVKGKVLAAMSHGIPCVLSAFAAEGIGLRHGHDSLICRTPQDWVEAIMRLHKDDKLWQKLSDNARAYMQECYSFERGVAEMRAAFEAVELYGA